MEEQIAEIETQIRSIRQEQISGDNVYQLLLTFDQLYAELTEPEKKEFMRAIIERIDIYPEKRPDGCWIRNIVFNFPVPVGGKDIRELLRSAPVVAEQTSTGRLATLENSSILETVVLLSQHVADDHIEVELDLDEMDITSAETKATYREIHDYVLEHTGLMVSNLYIAQVKKKCGIIERLNYNKAKSDHKQPQCPPEKEAAIMDALKHFEMI